MKYIRSTQSALRIYRVHLRSDGHVQEEVLFPLHRTTLTPRFNKIYLPFGELLNF